MRLLLLISEGGSSASNNWRQLLPTWLTVLQLLQQESVAQSLIVRIVVYSRSHTDIQQSSYIQRQWLLLPTASTCMRDASHALLALHGQRIHEPSASPQPVEVKVTSEKTDGVLLLCSSGKLSSVALDFYPSCCVKGRYACSHCHAMPPCHR
jgi:hypothetical protein